MTNASSFSSDIAIDDITVNGIGAIFYDGFESGNLSAWTTQAP